MGDRGEGVGGGGGVDQGLCAGFRLVGGGGGVMDHGGLIHGLRGVHGGGVVHRLHGAVGGGGSVAVGAGVDYWGGVVDCVNSAVNSAVNSTVNSAMCHVTSHRDGGISVSLCTNSESHRSQ